MWIRKSFYKEKRSITWWLQVDLRARAIPNMLWCVLFSLSSSCGCMEYNPVGCRMKGWVFKRQKGIPLGVVNQQLSGGCCKFTTPKERIWDSTSWRLIVGQLVQESQISFSKEACFYWEVVYEPAWASFFRKLSLVQLPSALHFSLWLMVHTVNLWQVDHKSQYKEKREEFYFTRRLSLFLLTFVWGRLGDKNPIYDKRKRKTESHWHCPFERNFLDSWVVPMTKGPIFGRQQFGHLSAVQWTIIGL